MNSISERWNNVLCYLNGSVPYLTLDWYLSALDTIDADKQPFLLFFKSGTDDLGFAPLVHQKKTFLGFSYHAISFVDNPYTPWQGFIYKHSFGRIFDCLIGHLRRRFGRFFSLNLDEVRLSKAEEEALNDLARRGLLIFHKEEKAGSRYLLLKEDFEHTLDSLKKKTQREFKRKVRRLSGFGELDLIRICDKAQMKEHLDCFFKLYARTWKGEEPQPEFYYKICSRFHDLGSLYFYALAIGGTPIAYLLCLQGQSIIYGVKTTYDPSYYAYSPGIVLFYKCIEEMFNIPGIKEFDIGRGNEQFKQEWTSLSHPHTKLLIYPNTVFWQIVNQLRYNILPWVRSHERLERIYLRLRSHLPNFEEESVESSPKVVEYDDPLVMDDSYDVDEELTRRNEPHRISPEEPETLGRIDPEEVEQMVQERHKARKARDWDKADAIRDELSKKGITVEDKREGTIWRFKGD